MAKSKNPIDLINKFANEKILEENMEDIFGERFGRYSKYIIQDRALPDARDGLKPVQRRILYAMYRLGMFPNKPYKKSARIVGEVIGKYHPHGDTSVYDAMVRMSQDFKILLPLIDMHGNNGSIDGDGAAAMRYTEARLSKYAEYLLKDLNKKTVGFVPNFDDEEIEPTVLPAKFPALLANGATGISAGYATNIPPHNIDELITASIHRINHPDCSLEDIMQIIQGPDFPTGGIIQGVEGIKEAYRTGLGKIVVKAKTEIYTGDGKINQLIITEIPYEVNKAQLVKKMNEMYTSKNVDGIIEIRDETDREGLRIVVDMKKDANAEFIRDFFFKTTELQINYSFNMVAISNKRPMQMGLLDLLDCYIAHQREVLTNRSNFELKTAKKRLHIVEGLIAMVSILDSVIHTIRNSANKKDAKENLVSLYSFTEEQAEAIVMLQLYKLTNTDIVALQNEQKALNEQIKELEDVLSNDKSLLNLIKKELLQTLNELTTPRKTTIENEIDELQVEVKKLIPKEDVVLVVTNDGYIKRMTPKNYNVDEEEKVKDEDVVTGVYNATTLDTLLLFTNKGNYVYLPVQNIPEVKHKDFGENISTLASIEHDEKVIFTVPISDFEDERYILFTTKLGLTKRTHIKDFVATRYSKALKATKIRDDDELVSIDICSGSSSEVVVVTKEGFFNRYDSNEISVMAPPSFGVKALELKGRPNDEVIGAHYINSKDIIVLLTNKGSIKRVKPNEIYKGHKNNVGKQLFQPTGPKTFIINSTIIHGSKKNEDYIPKCYLFGDKGYAEMEFEMLRNAAAAQGKKINASNIGQPTKLLITRNDNDFN